MAEANGAGSVKERNMTESKKYRTITIVPGLKGFKVMVGCVEIYLTTYHELLEHLKEYFQDPPCKEKEMLEKDQRQEGGMRRVRPIPGRPFAAATAPDITSTGIGRGDIPAAPSPVFPINTDWHVGVRRDDET
jgi:hypothetical protein